METLDAVDMASVVGGGKREGSVSGLTFKGGGVGGVLIPDLHGAIVTAGKENYFECVSVAEQWQVLC